MRLTGYACRHPQPPLLEAFLPLQGLTVLLGPNDSGKSSLLRAVERDLRGGHYEMVAEEDRKHVGGIFFAEVTDGELGRLVIAAQRSVRRVRNEHHAGYLGRRPPWGLRGWRFEHLPSIERDGLKADAAAEAWLAVLREHTPSSEGFDIVLHALEDSRLLGFEPAGLEQGKLVWNVFWCLPPLAELEKPLADALSASPLRPFADQRDREHGRRDFMRGFYEPFHGRPRHLWVDGAPVVVAPIGQAIGTYLPRGLAVPVADFRQIREAVTGAANALTSAARHGLQDAQREDPLDEEEREARGVPRNWLEAREDGSYRVHPDASAACAFLASAANRLMPSFIAESYDVQLVLRDIAVWFTHGALDLTLERRRDDALVEDFAVEEVAEGYRLWLQLALLEACEQAARVSDILAEYASAWWDVAEDASRAYSSGDPDADDLAAQAEPYEELFNGVRGELHRLAANGGWVTGVLRERLDTPPPSEFSRRALRHNRLFVVDEPERHLHPRRQREAARWLADTTSARRVPCLAATHSTAFLSLPGSDSLSYIYVERNAEGLRLRTFNAGELEALDEAVTVLGFDRGELLTTIALFLVVEGRHDQEVLDRAFGSELHAAHVAVMPMDGVGAWRAVLDSEALWRYSTAAVALATDKFDRATLEGLLADEKKLRALRRSDAPEETKVLAKLLGTAQQQGKVIHLLGHHGADLIDVLDEGVVRSVYPDYPGHQIAQRRWQAEVENGANARDRKAFYEREFRVPNDVRTYMTLGDAHATAGVKPAQLQTLVEEAVALASDRGVG